MFSGIVKHRDPKQMNYTHRNFGYVEIFIELISLRSNDGSIIGATEAYKQLSQKKVTIIENKQYFEASYHVLKCVQGITEDNFPFQDLIVDTRSEGNRRPELW